MLLLAAASIVLRTDAHVQWRRWVGLQAKSGWNFMSFCSRFDLIDDNPCQQVEPLPSELRRAGLDAAVLARSYRGFACIATSVYSHRVCVSQMSTRLIVIHSALLGIST